STFRALIRFLNEEESFHFSKQKFDFRSIFCKLDHSDWLCSVGCCSNRLLDMVVAVLESFPVQRGNVLSKNSFVNLVTSPSGTWVEGDTVSKSANSSNSSSPLGSPFTSPF